MTWLVALAVAPGVFWLWYFRRRDQLRPEPRRLVRRVFVLGALAAVAAGAIEAGVFVLGAPRTPDLFGPASVAAAVVTGAVEEAAKLLAVYAGSYRQVEFDEVMDGILYTVTAALGFATLENIVYVVQGGAAVGLLRAVLAVPGHVFFGAVMGFHVGIAKFAGARAPLWFALGLVLAAASHAAYDAALFTGRWLALAVLPFVFLLWRATLHYVRRALAIDEARLGRRLAPARRVS